MGQQSHHLTAHQAQIARERGLGQLRRPLREAPPHGATGLQHELGDITVIDKAGASRLSGQVSTGVQELRALLKAQTGIDLLDLARGRGNQADAGAAPETAPQPVSAQADGEQSVDPDEVGAAHPS